MITYSSSVKMGTLKISKKHVADFNHENQILTKVICSNCLCHIFLLTTCGRSHAGDNYRIFISNEKAGTLTVINGGDFKVAASIPVGKRPRGIHASPDGKTVYIALSGTPIEPPPQLDANGNPILEKNSDDDDDKIKSDKSADGIGLVDAVQKKFLRKIPAGSDPEQFCLSPDGTKIYIANEDVSAATVLEAATGKVVTFVPVSREPEGVGASPDDRFFYVTCETAGDVFAIDARTYKVIGHIVVHPRPRSVAFLPDGSRAFIPSESVGELNVIDTASQTLLKVIEAAKRFPPDDSVGFAGRQKNLRQHRSRRGGDRGGREHLRAAEHDSCWQTSVGYHAFAGRKIPVQRKRPFR